MFRWNGSAPEFLLVHPGGPLWAKKDLGVWSIPKGEFVPGEDPLSAACREFEEETGVRPNGPFVALEPVRLPSGKRVAAWGFAGDLDPDRIRSNRFTMEWPPRSGRRQEFPEIDRAAWFDLDEALRRLSPGQRPILEEMAGKLREWPLRKE
jgi:predicted NUDIX family NTP pyrophosphohydrolase